MDCRTARSLLLFHRAEASELDVGDQQLLEAHLATCPECDALTRTERHLDQHVGKAIRDVPIPANLRKRLLVQLAQNREEWYRRWLARGMRVAAVAALVLVALYVGLNWQRQNLPRLDADTVTQVGLEPSIAPPTRDDAERWFRKRGERVLAPESFNYQYLASYSMGDFAGKTTPLLHFIRETTTAEVYVLSSEHYDFSELKANQQPEENGYRFKVQIWKPGNGYVYVIRYVGNLNDLLRNVETEK